MKAVTLRDIPPPVAREIEKRQRRTGTSINKVVIELLEAGAGLSKRKRPVLHHDLDALAGSWSRSEAKRFDKELRRQRRIDRELWK